MTEAEVLELLRGSGHEWHRPMDIGGRNGSKHSEVLNRLVRRGLVERKPRATLANELGGRGSYLYRLVRPHLNLVPGQTVIAHEFAPREEAPHQCHQCGWPKANHL